MKVSDVIKLLEEFRRNHGDAELYSVKDDGKSSWDSPWNPVIRYGTFFYKSKTARFFIKDEGY